MGSSIQEFIQKISQNQRFSLPFAFLIEAISALQVLHLILKTTFTSKLHSIFTFSGFTRDVTSYTGATIQFDSLTANTSIQVVWFVLNAYLILHIILFIVGTVAQGHKEFRKVIKPIRVLSIAYILHSRLFFFPIQYFFLGVIRSYINCSIDQSNLLYCQDLWIGLTIVSCLLNTLITVLIELFIYDINKFKNTYAANSNIFHQIVLLHKALALLVYFLFPKDNYVSSVEAAIHALLTTESFAVIYIKLPFYQIKLMKFRVALIGGTLASSLVLILKACSIDSNLLEITWMMLNVLFIKSSLTIFNNLIVSIMRGGIETPEKAIQFCLLVKEYNFGHTCARIHKRKVPYSTLIASNSLARYRMKDVSTKTEEISVEYEQEIYRNIMETMNGILSKYPKSIPLLLFMAQIYLKKLENIPQAISLAKRASELNVSFALRNSVRMLNTQLKQIYARQQSLDAKTLDLINYFTSRKTANNIKDSILTEIQKHYELWQEVKSDKVDAKKIFDLATEISTIATKIEAKFKFYQSEFTKTVSNALLMYRLYIESVWELSTEARKVMRQFTTITNNNTLRSPLEVYSDQDAVVIVSLQKDKAGTILDVSGSAQSLFEIDKSKMIGRNLEFLLATSFAQYHMNLIRTLSRTLNYKLDHKFTTFAKDQAGDIFQLDAHLQLYPEIEQEIKLMIRFHRASSPMPILITTSDGTIVESSERVKSYNDRFTLGMTRLQSISPDFNTINSAFNMVYNSSAKGKHITRDNSKADSLITAMSRPLKTQIYSLTPENKEIYSASHSRRNIEEDGTILTSEKAHLICETFLQGGQLTLYNSYRESNVDYEVQIEPYTLDGQFYKIIKIGMEQEVKNLSKPSEIADGTKRAEGSEDNFAEEFPLDDEEKIPKSQLNKPIESLNVDQDHKLQINIKTISHKGTNSMFGSPFTRLILPNDDRRTSKVLSSFLKLDESPAIKRVDLRLSTSKTPAKKNPIVQNMSVSSYLTGTSHSFKMLRRVFAQKSTYTLSKKTFILVSLTILAMLGMAALFYDLSRHAMSDYENNLKIINIANQRLEYAIQTWQFSVQSYLVLAGLRNDTNITSQASTLTNAINMLKKNNELTQLLSADVGTARLESIYLKDVSLWEPCRDQTTNDGLVDTFLSTNLLFNMAGSTIELPKYCPQILGDSKLTYLLNNTINDYLLSSERLIRETQIILDVTVQNNILNLEIITICLAVAIFSLCLMLVVISYMIMQSYKRLFRSLMRVEEAQILERMQHLKIVKTILSQDIEAISFGSETINLADDGKIKVKNNMKGKDNGKSKSKKLYKKNSAFSTRDDRFFLRGLISYLARYVTSSFLFISIPSVFFLVSLIYSINTFHTLDELDDKLSATTNVGYQSRILTTNYYISAVFQDTDSIMIRNQLPSAQLSSNLQLMKSAHERIIYEFVQLDQVVPDPVSNQMLQDTVCSLLPNPTDSLLDSCQIATQGEDNGLLSVDDNFVSTMSYYVQNYQDDPVATNSSSTMSIFYSQVEPLIVTLENGYAFLSEHVRVITQTQIDDFFQRQVYLFAGIIIALVVSAIAVYVLSVRKFKFVDMGRGRILKIIPYKMISENKALEFYLSRDFKKNRYLVKK